jgi:cytochrome c oxidase assembly protein subunit 11
MTSDRKRRRRKTATVLLSLVIVAGMVGLSYASVPLYRLFCQATGYQGATRTALRAPAVASAATITVRLDANVNNSLPWSFAPETPEVKLAPGESVTAVFRVKNLSARPTVGSATFNVTPFDSGQYFNKIQCFCFTEHALKPGESAELPVTFFVDPKIRDNPDTADIGTITLSYTFFRAEGEGAAGPRVKPGDAGSAARPAATVN